MVKNNFVGIWRLVVSQFTPADGAIIYPYGKDALGMLIYDRDRHMSVQIMRPDRSAFVSGDLREGTPEEIKAAFDGYVAYFGTYEVNEEESTVTHSIKGSLFPNWIGLNQKRFFEFSGNCLTLKTQPMPAAGTTVYGILVWERDI